jgi:hypothetical protein
MEKHNTVNDVEITSTTTFAREQPLVFISHDTRDADLATAFSRLLISVSAGVLKSFQSSDNKGTRGIEYGIEWYPEIMNKLDVASDVVCLLTTRSLNRPWILYEAGVAKGKLQTPVHGLALGIKLREANTGPFAQFQNSADDVDSVTKLVMQLLKRVPNAEPEREDVMKRVAEFREKSIEILEKLDDHKTGDESKPNVDDANIAQLFEEVKIMFSELPSRLDGKLASMSVQGERRKDAHRYKALLFREIRTALASWNSQTLIREPQILLIFVSLFREDAPWIYETGVDLYRALTSNRSQSITKALNLFRNALEFSIRAPFAREAIGYMQRENMLFLDELYYLLQEIHISPKLPKAKGATSSEVEAE